MTKKTDTEANMTQSNSKSKSKANRCWTIKNRKKSKFLLYTIFSKNGLPRCT